MMARALTLRHLPAQSLAMAHHLCEQTGLSMTDVLRQAIVSGLLVEATKQAPDEDGTYSGLDVTTLAKALRRHLGSAIDLLIEQGEHPSQNLLGREQREHMPMTSRHPHPPLVSDAHPVFEGAMGDDLDLLGFGAGLSASIDQSR